MDRRARTRAGGRRQRPANPAAPAPCTGDGAAVQRLILCRGADVNVANRYGVTPLSVAQRGRGDLIDATPEGGRQRHSAEAGLPEGQTLVMHAARAGDIASLKALIAAGSNRQRARDPHRNDGGDLGGDRRIAPTPFACWPRPARI